MDKGLVHIYMGGGKGKTTAAMGLAMRAAGRGRRVYIVQFLKTSPTGEVSLIEGLNNPDFRVFRFETPHGFFPQMDMEQRAVLLGETAAALEFIGECMDENGCDMLVLDEILGAAENGLLPCERLVGLVNAKPVGMELVFTGRVAPPELIAAADYVTEMLAVKNPYDSGVQARCGIEY